MTAPEQTRQQRVLVIGSLNVDLSVSTRRIPVGGETVTGSPLRSSPGGKSANQAVAAALMGTDVALVGAVGADQHGEFLKRAVSACGVDASHVHTVDFEPTGSALITVDASAENTIVVSPGANAHLQPAHLPEVLLGQADIISLALEIPLVTVEYAARRGSENGAMVVLNLSPFRNISTELLSATSLLLVNEHELAALTGPTDDANDWTATRNTLQQLGARTTVVTLGPKGCVILDSDSVIEFPGVPIQATDTTGSGDAFTGSLLSGLAKGLTLHDAVKLANTVGAYTATRRGAQSSYPSTAELETWNRSQQIPEHHHLLAQIHKPV